MVKANDTTNDNETAPAKDTEVAVENNKGKYFLPETEQVVKAKSAVAAGKLAKAKDEE